MQQRDPGYAGISGIRLLEHLVQRHGELFDTGEAVARGIGSTAGTVTSVGPMLRLRKTS